MAGNDNIEAAMKQVAETISPTVPPNTNTDENTTASKQVLIRATEQDRTKWKMAAEHEGISLSEFIRNACNAKASSLLECQHPADMRKFYPWGTTCLKCKAKLS